MENILAYVPSLNRFVDHNDIIVHDISSLLNHWQVQKWMHDGYEDVSMQAKDGSVVHLLCLDANEENDLFDYLGFQESYGMKIERRYY